MNPEKTGAAIRALRLEKQMTQRTLAERLNVSEKTVSKWECGGGLPDISLLERLSAVLGANIESLMRGGAHANSRVGGNMKSCTYYVCPQCGNLTVCTGNAEVSCCGRRLERLTPQKAEGDSRLMLTECEDEWLITGRHPMEKENYISFLALVSSDRIRLIKLYPEWDLQVRIPRREHGHLLWYSTTAGLFYQPI